MYIHTQLHLYICVVWFDQASSSCSTPSSTACCCFRSHPGVHPSGALTMGFSSSSVSPAGVTFRFPPPRLCRTSGGDAGSPPCDVRAANLPDTSVLRLLLWLSAVRSPSAALSPAACTRLLLDGLMAGGGCTAGEPLAGAGVLFPAAGDFFTAAGGRLAAAARVLLGGVLLLGPLASVRTSV